jgi:hypothetical protein
MSNNKKLIDKDKALHIAVVSNSTVFLNTKNYYGDGQFYFSCDECGEQMCGRTTETLECICGHKTDCVYDYE